MNNMKNNNMVTIEESLRSEIITNVEYAYLDMENIFISEYVMKRGDQELHTVYVLSQPSSTARITLAKASGSTKLEALQVLAHGTAF